ncbi:MAG: hypothetical protein ABIR28_03215 [Vicinamibacteria bacterium]
MFGKPYSAYLRFQWPFLTAIAVVGFIRLGLSIAGQPDSMVKFFSMTVVGIIGSVYYAMTVRRSGFGNYRELIPLIFNQNFLANSIAILGIILSIYGMPNILDVPEFKPPFARESTSLQHALAHLFLGNIVGTLFGWIITSMIMAIGGGRKK